MANQAPKGGLTPVMMADGMPYVGFGRACWHDSGDSVALGIGDAVCLAGSSNSAKITTASGKVMGATEYPIGALPTVVKVTDGDNHPIYGVVVGMALDASTTMSGVQYGTASTGYVVYVETNSNVVYEIQSDGAANLHAAGDIGSNANITSSVPSSTTGRSSAKLDSSSMTTTYTYQLRILGVSRDINKQDFTSAGPSFLVKINNSQYVSNTAGV